MTEKAAGSDRSFFDAAIVGAGPAGVSCAVWLALLGFRPVVLEASEVIGGLCYGNPYPDPWTVCLPGATGDDIARNLAASLEQAKVPVLHGFRAAEVESLPDGFVIQPGAGQAVNARFLVVASGVMPRGLPEQSVPPAAANVLVGPGAHILAQRFEGKRVAVLGGGDNAFENALHALDRRAAAVHIYARTVRAQQQFVERFDPACIYHGDCVVDIQTLTVNGCSYDLILVFYGWQPRSQFTDALGLARTADGYLQTEPSTAQTSVAGVYAIGEVARRQHPCVVTAMADGITAAKAIQTQLEAVSGRTDKGQPPLF